MTQVANLHNAENCPDPVQTLLSIMERVAELTNTRICDEAALLRADYTSRDEAANARIDALSATVDSLSDVPDLTNQLTQLQSLLEALDIDGDGSPANDLLGIKNIAEQALNLATSASSAASSAQQGVSNNANVLSRLQLSFQQLSQQCTSLIEALAVRVSNLEGQVTELQQQVADMGTGADALYCNFAKLLSDSADMLVAQVGNKLTACPVPSDEGSDAGVPSFGSGI